MRNTTIWLKTIVMTAALILVLPILGCGGQEGDDASPGQVADALVEGEYYEVEYEVLDDGTLLAVEIEPADADEESEEGESIVGQLEEIGELSITIGGVTIAFDENTEVDEDSDDDEHGENDDDEGEDEDGDDDEDEDEDGHHDDDDDDDDDEEDGDDDEEDDDDDEEDGDDDEEDGDDDEEDDLADR